MVKILPKQLNTHEIKYTMFQDDLKVCTVIVSEFSDVYNINALYVDVGFRNLGFGTKMLEFIISKYTNKPLELGVKEDNLEAIKLYEKCGFKTKNTFYQNNIKFIRKIRGVNDEKV